MPYIGRLGSYNIYTGIKYANLTEELKKRVEISRMRRTGEFKQKAIDKATSTNRNKKITLPKLKCLEE